MHHIAAPAITPALSLALAVAAAPLAGCVTDTAESSPRRTEIREIPRPNDLAVRTVGFAVDASPEDTDSNGYFDTYAVTAYLFPRQNIYPLSIHAPGDMAFTLADRAGNTLARWRLTEQDRADNRYREYIGELYRFELSLLDADLKPNPDNPTRPPDRLRPAVAYLSMTYTPNPATPDEEPPTPIRADKALSVRVGPTGL